MMSRERKLFGASGVVVLLLVLCLFAAYLCQVDFRRTRRAIERPLGLAPHQDPVAVKPPDDALCGKEARAKPEHLWVPGWCGGYDVALGPIEQHPGAPCPVGWNEESGSPSPDGVVFVLATRGLRIAGTYAITVYANGNAVFGRDEFIRDHEEIPGYTGRLPAFECWYPVGRKVVSRLRDEVVNSRFFNMDISSMLSGGYVTHRDTFLVYAAFEGQRRLIVDYRGHHMADDRLRRLEREVAWELDVEKWFGEEISAMLE